MDYSQPFSALNETLRPRITTSDKLYSSLTRLEDRQWYSVKVLPTSCRPTILPANPEPIFSVTTPEPEDPKETEVEAEQRDLISDYLKEGCCADPQSLSNSCLTELNLKDEGGEEQVDGGSSISPSEEKDIPGELASQRTGDSSQAAASEGESSFQTSYLDGTLPDLIRSGRPIGRRRTLGHVTDTLNEVRREVELSRKRSIKLKAQVDKLQENREGPGWSQHRERVTEEVLSVLRLLHPLTELESGPPEPSPGENQLDAVLALLQNVARKLAISHTTQSKSGKSTEESAILQQALYDRDEAIERKKAMETELLRSKTEMMMLNNQLLEAVQKRLELSLELEAWKEDVQLMLQQQVQSQQQAEQAEQAQKKPSRMGILRRHNKLPMQRPSNITTSTPAAPTTNSSQICMAKSASPAAPTPRTVPAPNIHRTWRDKLKKGKSSRQGDLVAAELDSEGGFQVICLD